MRLVTNAGLTLRLKKCDNPKAALGCPVAKIIHIGGKSVEVYAEKQYGYNYYININKKWYNGNIFELEKLKEDVDYHLIYED